MIEANMTYWTDQTEDAFETRLLRRPTALVVLNPLLTDTSLDCKS